jgi:hypothetical protein
MSVEKLPHEKPSPLVPLCIIADLANIPGQALGGFLKDMLTVLEDTTVPRVVSSHRETDPEYLRLFLEAERTALAARRALESLTDAHEHDLRVVAVMMGLTGDDEPMPVLLERTPNFISDAREALTKFLITSANITGSDPHRKKSHKGFTRNWYIQHILKALFELPMKHGGNISFDTNEENGGGHAFNLAAGIMEYLILGGDDAEGCPYWHPRPTNRLPWPSFSTVRRIRDEVRRAYKRRNAKEKKV